MAEGAEQLDNIQGVLLDLDGTVFVGDQLVPRAAEAIAALRRGAIPIRFGTNTTRMSRDALVQRIRRLGVEINPEEVFTAPLAALSWLEKKGIRSVALCVPEATRADFARCRIDHTSPEAVIIGDLGSAWDFNRLNRAFLQIMGGAEFVALQRNRYWETGQGLALDAGAFVAALEYATGRTATIVGKPSQAFFEAAASSMAVDLANVAVVGDDVTTDVAGAQRCGAVSVLVRTGKFREDDLSVALVEPDLVLDSVASLPSALGVGLD